MFAPFMKVVYKQVDPGRRELNDWMKRQSRKILTTY